ncbi:mitochondrial membrane protein [Nowakowskiella sp. JEL0078]|nr:mitochondrial membrane protein [Nowakowskiella sp. JEL0078]
MSTLPYAVEAEMSLSQQELEILKEQYIKEESNVKPQTKFNYAWALVRSRVKSQQEQGVELLQEIYRENPNRRRECLYYLALGSYKLGRYREARNHNDTLLKMEAENQQALSLRNLIDEKVRSEGLMGMALVGTAAATVVLGFFMLRSRNN